jgi:hypothetical protein
MNLKQHQNWKSANKRESSQHAASLSISYKKIGAWSDTSLQETSR